jgi:hypothetical protein
MFASANSLGDVIGGGRNASSIADASALSSISYPV